MQETIINHITYQITLKEITIKNTDDIEQLVKIIKEKDPIYSALSLYFIIENDLVNDQKYGVELDCDAIQDFPSSAQTPSGISTNDARLYLTIAGSSKNAVYLHLPEAAPALVKGSAPQVGKLLAYLVSDFVKAKKSFSGS